MEVLLYFTASFLILFFGRLYLYKKSKKEHKKGKKAKKEKSMLALEIKYLSKKFSLDENRLDNVKIMKIICALDALVISLTFACVIFIEDILITFILGITLVFVLIYGLFELLGHILKKKGYEK